MSEARLKNATVSLITGLHEFLGLGHAQYPNSHLYKLMHSLISWTHLSWFTYSLKHRKSWCEGILLIQWKIRRGQYIILMRGCTTYMYIVLVIRSSPIGMTIHSNLKDDYYKKSFWSELLKVYFPLIFKHLTSSFR